MSQRAKPPFRADHVGSFLRPKYLLDAREKKARGDISAAELRKVEDTAIAEIVKFQEDPGLQASPTANSAAPISISIFWSRSAASRRDIPVMVNRPDGTEDSRRP